MYWSNLARFLSSEGGGALDHLERLLPELTGFCHYVRHFVLEIDKADDDDGNWIFVAKQLIGMTEVFDLADEVKAFALSLSFIIKMHSFFLSGRAE